MSARRALKLQSFLRQGPRKLPKRTGGEDMSAGDSPRGAWQAPHCSFSGRGVVRCME